MIDFDDVRQQRARVLRLYRECEDWRGLLARCRGDQDRASVLRALDDSARELDAALGVLGEVEAAFEAEVGRGRP